VTPPPRLPDPGRRSEPAGLGLWIFAIGGFALTYGLIIFEFVKWVQR
jgi:hypothetical protein